MTFEMAALFGMGAIVMFGLIALLLAFVVNSEKKSDHAQGRHA